MATLALSSIGTALGGPIGGAIGSLIGHGIDQSLFGPGPRRGPRLNDLSVQTSSYGTPIPRVYGTMRVAGTVIWATELEESSEPQGGAKGQPDVIIYSYAVSMVVALSSRRARRIGRIWADGKLLRGAAGDFKVKTEFRFYPGDEDQEVDPLIASVEGVDEAPAYRGMAITVFEGLQLAEYGNRIPFLTFEIFGDDEAPSIGSILTDASDGAVQCSATDAVDGYAAYGSSRRAALLPLIEQFAVPLTDDGDVLRTPDAAPTVQAGKDDVGCAAGSREAPRTERSQVPARVLPRSIELSYYDPSRDFQTGQMRAGAASDGGVDEVIELPATLTAERAKALAETSLARRWAERDRLVLRLPPDRLSVEPGRSVRLADGSTWRVDAVVVEELVVRLELSRRSAAVVSAVADPGRHLPAPDRIAEPTTVAVLDLPDLGIGRHDVPTLQVAACQAGAGWRQVPIEVTCGGEVWTVASASAEAVIGTALTEIGDGTTVDVELADAGHWLESRDAVALANGANLAALGRELIQFGSAVPIGPKWFRLGGLLRGCRGTEWAMGLHAAGETFVLIRPGALQEIVLPPSALGASISVKAAGLADNDADPVQQNVGGEAMRPPSPVNLQAVAADGGLMLTWVRRSRLGWMRPEGTDVPLGESSERYRVTLDAATTSITFDAFEPRLAITADVLAGLTGDATISVVQIGDFAQSRPVEISVALGA